MPRFGNVRHTKKRRSSCSDILSSEIILSKITKPLEPLFPCPPHTSGVVYTNSDKSYSCEDSYTNSDHSSKSDSRSFTRNSSSDSWSTGYSSNIHINNCKHKGKSCGDSEYSSSYCDCTDTSSTGSCDCTDTSSTGSCDCTDKSSTGTCDCTDKSSQCTFGTSISASNGKSSAVWCSSSVTDIGNSFPDTYRPTEAIIGAGRYVYNEKNLPHNIFVTGPRSGQTASTQIILDGHFPIATSVNIKSMGNTRVLIFPKGNKIESFDACGNIVVGTSPYNISGIRGAVALSFMPSSVWGIMSLFRGSVRRV